MLGMIFMVNSQSFNKLVGILFVIIISIALAGCRITGGPGGSKSRGTTKTSYFVDTKRIPVILDMNTPKVRFKVSNASQFGDFKKHSLRWGMNMSMDALQKNKNITLHVTVYESDGTTVRKESDVKFVPDRFTKTSQIDGFSANIHPGKLQQYNFCDARKNRCNKSFIVEFQLVDGQSEKTLYLNTKSDVLAKTKCATFLFCKKPKELETIKTSTEIKKMM